MAPPTRTRRAAASRTVAPLAALLLAALVVLGAATATPWRIRMPSVTVPEPTASVPVQPQAPGEILPGDQPPPSYDVITWIVVALSVAGAVLVAVLLWLLARRVLRALAVPEDDDVDDLAPGTATTGTQTDLPLPELQDAVATALDRVDRAATPHDAVVAAWVALEDAAARHGTRRDPAQTATEFTARLLTAQLPTTPGDDGATMPAADVDTLRRLYQRARFTDRPVGPDAVDTARASLSRIARALDPAGRP
ncbi:DUF4129 domain-containing protein [Krasilnikoviella flava]|uniref:Protein-glutamine gamma-glutamyltransferase-like C-terminal domain-containing protein n=1 Tax=Krasilnikoviella flava TaxID=526729 RepID=A0A1T5L5B3_9MICO|nr:DUF4129 domain-containing protein [Krasilnikoviella flava]SKC71090.1 protein of unknown function [Krasilnikoviella flava]